MLPLAPIWGLQLLSSFAFPFTDTLGSCEMDMWDKSKGLWKHSIWCAGLQNVLGLKLIMTLLLHSLLFSLTLKDLFTCFVAVLQECNACVYKCASVTLSQSKNHWTQKRTCWLANNRPGRYVWYYFTWSDKLCIRDQASLLSDTFQCKLSPNEVISVFNTDELSLAPWSRTARGKAVFPSGELQLMSST